MRASRLPGKPLLAVAGRPMLEQVVARLGRCKTLDDIVVATTTHPDDDALASLTKGIGVRTYRGSEGDVLSRYVGALREAAADLVIRITSDCPLIDPAVVDRVVAEAEGAGACDYASNVIQRTYPRGLDAEAAFADALLRTDRLATSARAREHVTYFMYAERPELWVLRSVVDTEDNSDLRWTVDTQDDLDMISRLYVELDLARERPDYRAIVRYVRAHPEISALNSHVRQKAL